MNRLVIAVVLAFGSSAYAQSQECFTVAGEGARAQYVVGLDTIVRLSAQCEYAVAPGGPWIAAGALAARDTDFLEIFQHAGGGTGDPRLVLGRRPSGRRADPVQHTLLLRYCSHYLLEEQLAFRVTPQPGGGGFRIDRTSGGCDGERVELRAVRGGVSNNLYTGAADQTLGTAQASLTLDLGDWAIYAARPGSSVGLRIGVFRAQRVVTPLANHLREVGTSGESTAPPLLAARWDAGAPGLLLHPTDAALASELLWPELRTAADAGLLWLADPRGERPTVISTVELEAGEPAAVRLPDSVVRDRMRETYGEAGALLAPNEADWASIFDRLAVCLTPSYHDARALAAGAAIPDAGACASLGGLAVLAQQAAGEARFCLRRGIQVITGTGVRHTPGEPECFPLPPIGAEGRAPYRIGVAGDRMSVQGEGLCVLLDNQPLAPGPDGEIVLDRSGLLEIRQAGGEGCGSVQSLARLRMPILDPQRDWHPVGLYTSASAERLQCSREDTRSCPWRVLDRDELDTFAFVESRHELEFRLTTSPQAAAAINADPTSPDVQLTQDIPVLTGVRGEFEGAEEPAIVAYVSRERACPSPERTFAELRARTPVDADDLPPDATFTVHLLAVTGLDAPTQCLARASFRMRPSRAIGVVNVEDFLGLELGLLGDVHLVFFANEPYALGLTLPLVWFRVALGQRYIVLDIAGNLVMAAALEPVTFGGGSAVTDGSWGLLTRTGVSISWAASFGVPEWNIPRLLSVGGMVHGAAETHPPERGGNPIVSFYFGLNLAALIDLAGGR